MAAGVVSFVADGHRIHHFNIAAPAVLQRELDAAVRGPAFPALIAAFGQGSDSRVWPADTESGLAIRAATGVFSLRVLHYCRRERTTWRARLSRVHLSRIDALSRGAAALLGAMRADSAATAWRARFDTDFDEPRRVELLHLAASALREQMGEEAIGGAAPARTDISEALWWTVLCEYEVAVEWHGRAPASIDATRAFLRASGRYLLLLKGEQRRHALEHFLASVGTSTEAEVERVLRENRDAVGSDEAVRSTFVAWFTTRYALLRALRLVGRTLHRRQIVIASIAFVMSGVAAVLFLRQTWVVVQVLLQVAAFCLFVFFTPDVFRLLLPRAWLGSLLAWLTIVLSEVVSIFPFTDNLTARPRVQDVWHAWLTRSFTGGVAGWEQSLGILWSAVWNRTPPPDAPTYGHGSFVAAVLLCAIVSMAFMSSELHMRVFRGAVPRTLVCYTVMLSGSLFWGAMLAYPVRYFLEKPVPLKACSCIFGAWILGSFLAVVFGIIVQLIWDDQSVGGGLREAG